MPAIALSTGAARGALPAPSPVSGKDKRPQLERAALLLFEPKPDNKGATPGGSLGSVPFQFNPKEVTIAKSAKWGRTSDKSAKTAGPVEFTGADPCKLTMEMFFDATGPQDGSVVEAVETLLSCCAPTAATVDAKKPLAPLVVLQWGRTRSFAAFVTSVSAKYTLFSSDGTPIRAVCAVAMEEMPSETERQNPTSGGRAVRRTHTVVDGDSLASVAHREYGSAAMWRPLAQYNGIDDPMRLARGTVLLLPLPEEFVLEAVL